MVGRRFWMKTKFTKPIITLFTTLFQGAGYLVMIGIANVWYFLGLLSERVVRPSNPERYRLICYRLGF